MDHSVQTEETLERLAEDFLTHGRQVLDLEASGIALLRDGLGESFVSAVKALLNLRGRVIVSGMGKSGHVAGKIAATLASTGTHINRLRVPLIAISSGADSFLMRSATIPLLLPSVVEACPVGIAPTTSTTMMLALGDALAMVTMQKRGFSRDDYRLLHPGGKIGLRLMRISEMMHRGERLPLVLPDTAMPEVIMTMTSKSFGIAGVVDADGRLLGVITDGDLRRNIDRLSSGCAADVMTREPGVIPASTLAEDALKVLNARKVTALFVVEDGEGEVGAPPLPVGIVNVHDFLRLGLV